MVIIKGIQKTSTIDYPDKICTVLFLPGCNFRCGFCQNPDLINNIDNLPTISEDEIFKILEERRNFIDGVCITGGEPLLHKDISGFIKKIKDKRVLVKLDTNGSNPEMLKQLIDKKLIDFIAMDIKSDKKNYQKAAGVPVDMRKIEKSIELIKNSKIDYEFRSTVVPLFFNEDIILNIGKWLKGSKKFALQQFRPNITLDPEFKKINPYPPEKLMEFAKLLEPYFEAVEVRG